MENISFARGNNRPDFFNFGMTYLWNREVVFVSDKDSLYAYKLINGDLYLVSQEIVDKNGTLFFEDREKKLLASFDADTTFYEYDEEALEICKTNFEQILNRNTLVDYLRNTLSHNQTVYAEIFSSDFRSSAETFVRSRRDTPISTGGIIISNIFTSGLLSLEKIITSCGHSFFATNICKDELCLANEKKKLKQVLGLPPTVIEFLKIPMYSSLYKLFKDIAENRDVNDTSLLVDYISTIEELSRFTSLYTNSLKSYIENLLIIALLEPSTKMQSIINYLHNQAASFRDGVGLEVPMNEATKMRDYLLIAKKNNIDVDPLPSNLPSAHYYIVENTKYSDDEEKAETFISAVNKYTYLEDEDKDFVVVAPKTIQDMIVEGQVQHHCIANYVDLVCNGTATVLFLRKKKEPNVPFISFEISEDGEFVQVKGKYDFDVEPDTDENVAALAFLSKWHDKKFTKEGDEPKDAEEVS